MASLFIGSSIGPFIGSLILKVCYFDLPLDSFIFCFIVLLIRFIFVRIQVALYIYFTQPLPLIF